MEKFETLTAIAAPMDEANIDTDQICPARFIKTLTTPSNDQALFHDRRFADDGAPKPDFILNDADYADAEIIVAQRNFGVGSSRQAAVFALQAAGIRAVIAESFGDIFYNNALKAGLLTVRLDPGETKALRDSLPSHNGSPSVIDLAGQAITGPDGRTYDFEIGALRKRCLLEGLDDLTLTEGYLPEIESFEENYQAARPWLF